MSCPKKPLSIRLARKLVRKYCALGRRIDAYCRHLEEPYNEREEFERCSGGHRQLLEANGELKGTKKGKRCFVLGNGPSLKTENLAALAGEDVFTVNQAARNPQFSSIKPLFHFWADPHFFTVDESKAEDREFIDVMCAVNANGNRPQCFFPIQQLDFVKRFHLEEKLYVRYFCSYHLMSEDYMGDFDFSTHFPQFSGVVLWAIALAVYMGYTEIYVLGIDSTSLMVNMKSYLGQNDDDDYSYAVTPNEQKRLSRMVQRQSLGRQAQSFIESLQQYEMMARYCAERGIKLVNCSSTTLVDTLPRMSLSEVLANSPAQP